MSIVSLIFAVICLIVVMTGMVILVIFGGDTGGKIAIAVSGYVGGIISAIVVTRRPSTEAEPKE